MTTACSSTKPPAVKKPRVFEEVHDNILAQISKGELIPGSKLPAERDLAVQFGVGRPAVREALRSLEMSGVLRFEKGASGGAFIREGGADGVTLSIRNMLILSQLPLSHLTEARSCVLGQAARLAAARGTKADFLAIEKNIDLTESVVALGDPVATIAPISEFYSLIGKASHNPVMAMLVDSLVDIVRELLLRLKLPTGIDLITPRRAALMAMRAGDAMLAEQLIREHLERSAAYVQERMDR